MQRSHLRMLALFGGLALFLVLSAIIYMIGMARLEGKERGFWQSLEWASETLSTTGYGADAKWAHPLMVLFVVFVQFSGVFLVFLIIPIFLVPFLEERFEERLPRKPPPDLRGHVIVYRFTAAVETLVERLLADRVPQLVVELDESIARPLHEDGVPVILGRSDADLLEECNLSAARAIVANGRDEENGALILKARQMGFTGDIYALVENPAHRRPMELAGATAAYTPRHILAAALAARASHQIAPRIGGLHHLQGVELREFRIPPSSPLAGLPFDRSPLARAGLTPAGQWFGGKLHPAEGGTLVLQPRAIVLLVGHEEHFAAAGDLVPLRREGPYLVAGFGEVGQKVREILTDAGETVRAIDRRDSPGVTTVGNVLDVSVLRAAGIADAQAVILALDTDDATLFATVIVRDLMPDLPIIARVNHARNVDNIGRAGADFALSISGVSGQMLSQRLLGSARLSDTHLSVRKFSARGWAVQHPSAMLAGSTCTIVGVERDGKLVAAESEDFRLAPEDSIYLMGSEEELDRLSRSTMR